jgi:hypothetical protein
VLERHLAETDALLAEWKSRLSSAAASQQSEYDTLVDAMSRTKDPVPPPVSDSDASVAPSAPPLAPVAAAAATVSGLRAAFLLHHGQQRKMVYAIDLRVGDPVEVCCLLHSDRPQRIAQRERALTAIYGDAPTGFVLPIDPHLAPDALRVARGVFVQAQVWPDWD